MRNEFIDYLKYQKKYSMNTISNYEIDLSKYFHFLENKNKDYLDINYALVSEYLEYLKNLKLSSNSIMRNVSAIRSFYRYLVKQKKISSNPFNLLSGMKKEKKLPNFLQFNEFEDILSLCSLDELGIRNRSILEMLIASGLRVSELINIKLNDIDFSEQSIKVIGKGSKTRIVYYGDYCRDSLNNYLNNSRKILLNKKTNDYLYLNHLGNKLTRRGIEAIIEQLMAKSSIDKKVSPHTFRHTFATMMINEGANVKVVQELLGHSSLDTTNIYTHITNDRLRSVYLKSHPRARK